MKSQFSLSTVLILMAVIASWLGYWTTLQRTEEVESELRGLQNVARELKIDDPNQYAIVQRLLRKNKSRSWDLFIPNNGSFELCLKLGGDLVTEQASPNNRNDWKPNRTISIQPGRHKIELFRDQTPEALLVKIWVDDNVVIDMKRKHSGLPTGSMIFSSSTQQSTTGSNDSVQQKTDQQFKIFNEVYHLSTTPGAIQQPTPESVLVWIRQVSK